MAKSWPNLTKKRPALAEAKEMDGKEGKLELFSANPGEGD
jgi:ferredoxin